MSINKIAGAAFALAAMVAASAGIAKADALDDIISRGTVRIAIDTAAPPFGYMNENNEPDGSDVVSAKLLAKDLGVKLEIVRTTSSNRIPYLTTGRADLTMSTLALNPERAKAVNFSSPYAIIRAVIIAPKKVKIETTADLAGKKISAPRGTTNETDAVAISPPGAEIIRFDDEAGAMNALASGQVDAYAVGEPLSLPLIKRYPERGYEAKIVLRLNYICVGIRRDQPEVAQWVNTWIHYHLHNDGQLKEIYKKFIGQELPPLPPL